MHKLLIATPLAIIAFGLGIQSASAFERKTTVETDRGTYTKFVEAECAGGYCYRESELIGPNGGTLFREGECWRIAHGTFRCRGKLTGPAGREIVGRGVFTIR